MSNKEITTGSNAAALLTSMTIESLRDVLQETGYRVETVGEGRARFLRSASNRFAFDIRPGSAIPGAADRFADVAFVALLAVQGTLPLDLINRWNCTRRFGRLFLDQTIPGQDFLVLSMDSSFAGGVSVQQMRVQVEIWDSLLQQFVPWLREELSKIAPKIDAVTAAASAEQNAAQSAETSVPAGAAA
ncbi:YbjN domain-containing protein [Microbacteriaceae bacterium K1510]|nr:YbjN domain-containing protein [Microbacteriaceae bacterium K1510]